MTRGIVFISNVTKAMEHEWFAEFVDKNEFDLEFVLFNSKNSDLYNFLIGKNFKCSNYNLSSKFYIPVYILYFAIKLLFKRVDFVHAHLFEASLIGMAAGKLAGIKKRIFTRHHADLHHSYHPGAVKYDLLINRLATHIIAVSIGLKTILEKMEKVPSEKITIIPHGLPEAMLNVEIPDKKINAMKTRYGLNDAWPIVGVISRFTEWKGIQYILPAFKDMLKEYPNARLVMANASGDYESHLQELIDQLPTQSYIKIAFETEIIPLFKTFDVFVHAPVDASSEAFGQVYIEAFSLGVPVVCTLSGVACQLVKHEENALVAGYRDQSGIYLGLKRILSDKELAARLTQNAKNAVKEYTFEKKFAKLKTIYQS